MLKSNTAKNIFSIVFGLLAGFSIVFIQLIIQYIIYPAPLGMDITNADATREFAALAPPSILILVIIFYSLATFAGGFVAATVAATSAPPSPRLRHAAATPSCRDSPGLQPAPGIQRR